MCPTPRTSTLRAPQVGVVAAAGRGRHDDLVEVAVDGGDRRAAAGRRLGQLPEQRRARAELADQRRRAATCASSEPWCGVPRVTRRLHPPVAALALHVVAGDQPAEAVPDDVHPVVAGLLADALDVRAEVGRAAGDVGAAAGCSSRSRPGRSRAGAGCGASRRRSSGCRPGRAPAATGMRAASGSAANRARTAGGWSPGRLRRSGRSCSVRVPSGYMSTWAPTQASSVSPPVSVAGLQRARRPPRGAPSGAAVVCDSGAEPGPLDRPHAPVPPRRVHRRRRGFGLAAVHWYVLRSPDGNAPVWRTSHRRTRCVGRSTPVRDQISRRGNRVARDARTGPVRAAPAARRPGAPAAAAGRPASGSARSARRAAIRLGPAPAPATAWSSAPCRSLARVAGVLLVLAGLVGRRRGLPDLPRGRRRSSSPRRPASAACSPRCWCPLAARWRSGVGLVRGAVPEVRAGLRRRWPARSRVGQLLIEIYRGSSSTARPGVEVLAGRAGADQRRRDRRRLGARGRRARR